MASDLHPYRPVSPGEILKEIKGAVVYLEPLYYIIAEKLGVPKGSRTEQGKCIIEEIVSGKRRIDRDVDEALFSAIGMSRGFWLRQEQMYQRDLERKRKEDDGQQRTEEIDGGPPGGGGRKD